MRNFHRLKELLLYAGLDKATCGELTPSIREQNRILLRTYSLLAAIAFFLLFLVSMFSSNAASDNAMTYLMTGTESLVILMATYLVLPRHPALVRVFVYIFIIMLHTFGIHIAMLHIEHPAVSAVAFLLVTPLMFYDRPLSTSALITLIVAGYCVMAARYKAPHIADLDIWNAITFGIVAVATTTLAMSVKVRAMAQSKQIEFLSQTDLLCGVKNRNHYEKRLTSYPDACASNISCVYADVNGLHEMNNSEGHAAGDEMLRTVARVMQERFGPDDTYRIGGDEFVAFRADARRDEIETEMESMGRELSEMGYHVSFGSCLREKTEGLFDMHSLVRDAEKEMYAAKQAYYCLSGYAR